MPSKRNTPKQAKSITTDVNSKSIYRVCKNKDNPYVQINKKALHDVRLSWKAKGIHCYMLSMPDDWVFYRGELEKHAADGREALSSGIRELVALGYAEVNQIRDSRGRISQWVTTVYETPKAQVIVISTTNGKPVSGEKPDATRVSGESTTNGFSRSGKPATTNNDPLTNNDVTNNHNDDFEKKDEQPQAKRTIKQRLSALTFDEKCMYDKLRSFKGVFNAIALSIVERHTIAAINNVLEFAQFKSVTNMGGYINAALYKPKN